MPDPYPDIAIVGIHLSEPSRVTDRSLEEMIFDVTLKTTEDAGLSLEDLDGVVISANDETDGRVISCMVTSGPAAGVNRDLTMIASASEHALLYAYMWLRSGQGRNVLVLAWGKPSESVHPEHAELVAAEPFVLRPHGMNDTVAAALQASALIAAGAADRPTRGDLVSSPLRGGDLTPRGDAVVGLVLTTADAVPEGAEPVWVRGVGWSIDRYDIGDRDLVAMTPLREARERALAMAGVSEVGEPSSVRLNCPSKVAFAPALEALAAPAVNARGIDEPEALAYPAYAAGLAAMALAAEDLRGQAGTALGASMHGFAGQGAAVVVLDSSERGGQA
jgi:hypothetical protein